MKFLTGLLAASAIFSAPFIANAHPLSIANNTNTALSFSVNHICSTEIGTVYENDIKLVSEKQLNKLCNNFSSPCVIEGFKKKHCSGKAVGGMTYNTEHDFIVFGRTGSKISLTGTESSLIYVNAKKRK